MTVLDGRSILLTGGTGSFAREFVATVLRETDVKRLIVFSRDELKQYEMRQSYPDEDRLRFFIGDVRDYQRVYRALHDVQVVIHAAALKQVPAAEYNPFEAVKTNVGGAQNVIEAAIEQGVERVIALSTDKACSPVNLYGATKLVSDKLFVAGNAYAAGTSTRFSVVRYGNVVGSRGSVVPLFKRLAPTGPLPITDERMTRFWITLQQGVRFVLHCLEIMRGGELFVPKIPSMRVVDLAMAMAPGAKLTFIGIRPGEKLHEEMISASDARATLDLGDFFIVQPQMEWWPHQDIGGSRVPEGFSYASNTNDRWLTPAELADMVNGA